MENEKYYWISTVTENTAQNTYHYNNRVITSHPFQEMSDYKNDTEGGGDTYRTTMLNYKEITKSEWELFNSLGNLA